MGRNRRNYEAVFVKCCFLFKNKKVLFFFLLTKKYVNIVYVSDTEQGE